MRASRRWVLRGIGAGAGAFALGCPPVGDDDDSATPPPGDDDDVTPPAEGPFAGATFEGYEELGPDPTRPMDETYDEGLDGRRYVDLADLEGPSPVLSNEEFYVRTRESALHDPIDWELVVDGLVAGPITLDLAQLEAASTDQGVHLMECSGNGASGRFGLLSAARWTGVPLVDVLGRADVDPAATAVLVDGFDTYPDPSDFSAPGASWVFTLAQVQATGMFLATGMNGVPLPADHGFPARLVVPGWYGCCCIKWVRSVRLVDASEPSTAQMQEFAQRTHQDGAPALAAAFAPADIHLAAMPIRVERWRRPDGSALHRVVGVVWGGERTTDALRLDWGDGPVRVDVQGREDARSWGVWEHAWEVPGPGTYALAMGVDDPSIPTRRLDSGWYVREVTIAPA